MSRGSEPTGRGSRRFLWAAAAAALALLVVAGLLAPGGSARAMGRGHWGGGGHDPEAVKEHMALGMDRALRGVDATDEQRERAGEIAEATFDALAPMLFEHRDSREQMVALLSAESIDREALETLRAEAFARFEAASRTLVGGLADLAETLTPEQRAELLEHGHGHRGWRRSW